MKSIEPSKEKSHQHAKLALDVASIIENALGVLKINPIDPDSI